MNKLFEGEKFFDYNGEGIPLKASYLDKGIVPTVYKQQGNEWVIDEAHTWSDLAQNGIEVSEQEFQDLNKSASPA